MIKAWFDRFLVRRFERKVFLALHELAAQEHRQKSFCAECDGKCEVCTAETDCD